MATPVLTTAQILDYADRLGAEYDLIPPLLAALLAAAQDLVTFVYGDGTTAHLSLGSPPAVNTLGPAALAQQALASGAGLYNTFLAGVVSQMSSLLSQYGGAASGLPASVRDLTSWLRYANGCPDPSPAGAGGGSDYSHLLSPSFAALQSQLTGGGSVFPPDVVFAPDGVLLGTLDLGAATFTAGVALMTPVTAPYAPATGWTVRAGATPPDGSLYVTVTGLNQAGSSVTWRGDAGTGLTAAGQTLSPCPLHGTDGGAGGGTAAPTDRLTSVTTIARDTSVSGGGTATTGVVQIVTVKER